MRCCTGLCRKICGGNNSEALTSVICGGSSALTAPLCKAEIRVLTGLEEHCPGSPEHCAGPDVFPKSILVRNLTFPRRTFGEPFGGKRARPAENGLNPVLSKVVWNPAAAFADASTNQLEFVPGNVVIS